MWTLRIYLMGLIALVPIPDPEGRASLTILLPDAQREHSHPHYPVLVCDPHSAEGCKSDQGDDICAKLKLPVEPTGYFVRGQLLLEPAPSGGVKYIENGGCSRLQHSSGMVPDSPVAASDVCWIPAMRHILPDSAEVRGGVLAPSLDGKLAARMEIGGGALSTYSLVDFDGRVPSFIFRKINLKAPVSAPRQALADIAALDIEMNTATASFYQMSGGSKELLLELKPKAGESVVEVLFGNLAPLGHGSLVEPALHFAHYVEKLSGKTVPWWEVPLPHYLPVGNHGRADKVDAVNLPVVIEAVGEEGAGARCKGHSGPIGGSDRPICTIVEMSAPVQHER